MCPTRCPHLTSCSPSIVSTHVSFRTSKTQGWIPQRQYRCRRYRSWCMWAHTHTHTTQTHRHSVCKQQPVGLSGSKWLVCLSGSGAPGLRSHWIRKDFGFLSPAARTPAAAGQPGLQSGGYFPNKRAGQPGTHTHTHTHFSFLLWWIFLKQRYLYAFFLFASAEDSSRSVSICVLCLDLQRAAPSVRGSRVSSSHYWQSFTGSEEIWTKVKQKIW